MTETRSRATYVLVGLCLAGLVTGVVGTFLPWLRSGTVLRDSYQVSGAIDHFDLLDNPFAAFALRTWVALPMLAAGCVILFACRLPRTAALASFVVAAIAGTISVLALVQAGGQGGFLGVTTAGPVTTTIGMTIALCGALGVLAVLATARRRGARTGRAGVRT